ncbi:MAG: hypothetical protein AB9903_11290 [Vulcanimicrobiota bacterium]
MIKKRLQAFYDGSCLPLISFFVMIITMGGISTSCTAMPGRLLMSPTVRGYTMLTPLKRKRLFNHTSTIAEPTG